MALDTVQDYVATARILLQDTVVDYRYDDPSLAVALSLGLMEARRIRPDLFIGRSSTVPSFTTSDATAVDFDVQYRTALLYYIVGHAQLRDEEDTQDARSAALLAKFTSQLTAGN